MGKKPVEAISLVKDTKTNFFCPHFDLIDKKFVENCHKNNIKINVWTVNEPEDIEKMIKLGVDIISSDYPNRVLEKLNK